MQRCFCRFQEAIPTRNGVVILTQPSKGEVQFANIDLLSVKGNGSIEKTTDFYRPSHQFAQIHESGFVFESRRRQEHQGIVHQLTTGLSRTGNEFLPARVILQFGLEKQRNLMLHIVQIGRVSMRYSKIFNRAFQIAGTIAENCARCSGAISRLQKRQQPRCRFSTTSRAPTPLRPSLDAQGPLLLLPL